MAGCWGRMLAVWYSGGPELGAHPMVYGRLIGADGLPEGPAFAVAEHVEGYHVRPLVSALSDGGIPIGWNRFAQFPIDEALGSPYVTAMVRKFDVNGPPVAGEAAGPVHPTTGQPIGGVFALADGGHAVGIYRGHQYLARFFDAAGQAVSGEFALQAHLLA